MTCVQVVNALNLGPRAPDSIFSPFHSQHSQSINKGSSVGITCIILNRRHSQIVAAQSEALNEMSFSNSSRTKMSSEKKKKVVAVVSGQ